MGSVSNVEVGCAMATFRATRRENVVVSEHCPRRPYLELKIPQDVASVHQIKFTITSHDQGFCDYTSLVGGYDGWTWFDCHVWNPQGCEYFQPTLINSNVVAHEEFRTHITTWNAQEGPYMNIPRALRPRDVIQVVPMARYPAWLNYICEVQIEVQCHLDTLTRSTALASSIPTSFYQQLSIVNKEIRILYLDPGAESDPISCHLATWTLHDPNIPRFKALSYCWGNPTSKVPIQVSFGDTDISGTMSTADSCTLNVTANLHEALRRLRNETTTEFIWADAICINQTDTTERNSQVNIMGEIYTKAASVAIWLGVQEKDVMTKVAAAAKEYTHLVSTYTTADDRFQKAGDRIPEPRKTASDLMRFFGAAWFRRVWVVQEVWLSRQAMAYCGNEMIPWESVVQANGWLTTRQRGGAEPGIPLESLPRIWTELQKNETDAASDDRDWTPGTTRTSRKKILELIMEGLELNATDPKDRIFALLGLAEETYPSVPLLLRPSYEKSTSQVFTDFTRWWISEYKSLAILTAVHAAPGRTWLSMTCPSSLRQETHDDHPSWALPYIGSARWIDRLHGMRNLFRAAGDTVPTPDPCKMGTMPKQLTLVGVRISEIKAIRHYPYSSRMNDDLHRAYFRLVDPANQSGVWSCGPANNTTEDKRNDPHSDWSRRGIQDHSSTHAWQNEMDAQFPCLDRCFIEANDGSVGLCPAGSQVGDLIVVLYGGSVPYVLRNAGTSSRGGTFHEFVGECYVAGKMDGSVVRKRHEGGSAEEEFHLI